MRETQELEKSILINLIRRMIDFLFENVQNFKETQLKDCVKKSVNMVLKEQSFKKKFYLSVLFTDDNGMRQINSKFRNKNSTTNVLSFPQNETKYLKESNSVIILGDIVISLEKILSESKKQKKTFSDHLCHMVVHRVFHLMGFNHQNDIDSKKMIKKEISVLNKL